ncbi:MAG: hypothetical protein WDO73_08000 [Ignavibacteriota bacterium]
MTDKQLADFLSRVKLTEKLEPRVIEDLEALDLGPLTRRALEKLRMDSQSLAASSVKQVLPDEPIPPPSSLEQGAILNDVREYVANYDNNLPDFVCTEVEHSHDRAQARYPIRRACWQRPFPTRRRTRSRIG